MNINSIISININININTFFKAIVQLGYKVRLGYFPQGGKGVPCPPFRALMAPP